MGEMKFAVLVIRYEPKNEQLIKGIVNDITKHIDSQSGKIECIYQGSDERIITALENVLKLAE